MELCIQVAADGSVDRLWRKHGAEMWLRVIAFDSPQLGDAAHDSTRQQVVCEERVCDVANNVRGLECQQRWKSVCVKIANGAASQNFSPSSCCCLLLELWEAESESEDAFLTFVGSTRIDLARWSERSMRWYALSCARTGRKEEAWSEENGFEECKEKLAPQSVYLRVDRRDFPTKPTTATAKEREEEADVQPEIQPRSHPVRGFQFVMPSEAITRNRRFLATRVGEILYEGNTGHLRDVLPVTLYGNAHFGGARSGDARTPQQQCLGKALQMLQLSCQYASYCVETLNANARQLEGRRANLAQRRATLRARQRRLEQRRRNLRREAQVLDSSTDGMRLLLQEVDPVSLALLQEQVPDANHTASSA